MSAIDREILPAALEQVFRQLVEKGAVNIAHPSRSSIEWAKFHWGHPDECMSDLERPRVFFYGVDFAENMATLCLDRVSISMVVGVQVDCSKSKSSRAKFEQLWYHIRRVFGKTPYLNMNFDVEVTDSLGITGTYTTPKLSEMGIQSPSIAGSVATQIQDGKILRYQGNLLFDLYFRRPAPELGPVAEIVAPPSSGIGTMVIGSTFTTA